MRRALDLDVSGLPAHGNGMASPLWWGMCGLMAIEGTMFVLLIVTYLFLGTKVVWWPPEGVEPPSLALATVNLAILLVSVLPAYWASEASARHDLPGVRRNLLVNFLMVVAFFAIRVVEWRQLSFRWDTHAYGSIVWIILALHTTHVTSAGLETLVFVVLAYLGKIGAEQRAGVDADSLYWYFVVAAWIPFYLIVFVVPRL
jgi:cytochrome c oxidase subunit III